VGRVGQERLPAADFALVDLVAILALFALFALFGGGEGVLSLVEINGCDIEGPICLGTGRLALSNVGFDSES
jgi:hypothetical protein